MRIWFAANHGDLGGGEVMTLNLARAARDLGYDVALVAPDHPDRLLRQGESEGFRTVRIHGRSAARYAVNLAAWDLLERRGLLWANGLRTAAATAGHRGRLVHLHQVPRGAQGLAARVASAGAKAVVVPSEFVAAAVPGAQVLPNWTHPFGPPDFDRRLVTGAGSGPIVLGYLGRLSSLKGVAVLADALGRLDARHPGRYLLHLAGEPTYASPADSVAVDAALAPVAQLVRRAGRQSPEEFFRSVDLAVVPSVAPEAFGLVVSEAMSIGCPFVISDAGALPETAGAHPYVARAGDADALVDAVDRATRTYDRDTLAQAWRRWSERYAPATGREGLGRLLSGLGVTP